MYDPCIGGLCGCGKELSPWIYKCPKWTPFILTSTGQMLARQFNNGENEEMKKWKEGKKSRK
jgi:hypothetical protein